MIRLTLLLVALGLLATYILRLFAGRRREWIAQVRSAFLTMVPAPREHGPAFKEVALRSRAVRLRVPKHWSEEYPDEERASFCDPARPERVFRVAHSLVVPAPGGLRDTLAAQAGPAATTFDELPTGLTLLKELGTSREGARDVIVFRWLLAVRLSPQRVRLATFALSVPELAGRDPATWDDAALLELEVRAVHLETT